MFLLLFFTLCIITPAFSLTLLGIDSSLEISADEKVYSHVSIDDQFTDDGIFVVLSNKASLNFNQFHSKDFSEIDCVAVTEYSSASGKKIHAQVEALSEAKASGKELCSVDIKKIQTFNQVLYLKLANPGKKNVLDAIDKLMLREDVIYAGPNFIYSIDPAAINPILSQNTAAYNKIQFFDAMEISTGVSDVLVGVMDTGIDATHPDLIGKVDTDLSCYFVNGEARIGGVTDEGGHGTLVAGIIAGRWNNANTRGGVAPNITLVSLDVMSGYTTYSTDIISAILYAEEHNIQIINFSASISVDNSNDVSLAETIHNFSGLFVCAAGNEHENLDENPNYPASYNTISDNMIVVGASNGVDGIWAGSSYGSAVDIFAPGEDILSTASSQCILFDGAYAIDSGTSYAAPFVTGVAALMLSVCPYMSPQQIVETLVSHADIISIPSSNGSGGGYFLRLNAYQALLNIPHCWEYISTDLTYHTKTCDCGTTVSEYHTWVTMGTKYRCQYCGYISVNPPII